MAGICDCGLIESLGADPRPEEIPRLTNLGTNLLRACRAAALLLFCSVVISAMDHLEPFTVALAAMVVVWVLILFYFVKMGGITSLTVRDYFKNAPRFFSRGISGITSKNAGMIEPARCWRRTRRP